MTPDELEQRRLANLEERRRERRRFVHAETQVQMRTFHDKVSGRPIMRELFSEKQHLKRVAREMLARQGRAPTKRAMEETVKIVKELFAAQRNPGPRAA